MKLNWLATAFLATGFVLPAGAQINVYLGTPPPLRYEVQPPMPFPGAAWVGGYWQPNGRQYQWMPGRWQQPPYPNAYWNHPHYDHFRQGWKYDQGHWDPNENGQRGQQDRNGPGHDNGNGKDHGGGNGNGNGHGNGKGDH